MKNGRQKSKTFQYEHRRHLPLPVRALDGYSRFIVHWEIRAQMQEQDIEIILQRARERVPEARPRIISDNGPQFIAKDFKVFIARWA